MKIKIFVSAAMVAGGFAVALAEAMPAAEARLAAPALDDGGKAGELPAERPTGPLPTRPRPRLSIDPVPIVAASTRVQNPAGAAMGKRAGHYAALIARHARANGVPLALAHAVIRVESNYRADARGRAGEAGLMQIKPATARLMGYRGTKRGLFDAETNIRYGMKYLGQAHRLGHGTTCGTILKYNAGHGARRMNRISSAYCAKVKRILAGRR